MCGIVANGKLGSLLNEARLYGAIGWSVIATRGKRAAGKWKQWQRERPDEKALQRMFAAPGVSGLAVILGSVSGNLACRDYDDADAYHRWAQAHPGLAATLPTVQTQRGYHVYGVGPDGFAVLPDGEYRADPGHYCLVPPSRHPAGSLYRWLIPLPDGPLPILSVESGLVPPEAQAHSSTHNTHTACVTLPPNQVDNIIGQTLPTGPGQRNRRIFALARAVKGIMPTATPAELREIVRTWHGCALPIIRTKDYATTWTDFVIAWQRVRTPKGAAWVSIVAQALTMPSITSYGDPRLDLLATLCSCLDHHHAGRPWALSCRKAGEAVGVEHQTAARWLRVLAFDGLIAVAKDAGPKGSRRAREYRYLGGQRQ